MLMALVTAKTHVGVNMLMALVTAVSVLMLVATEVELYLRLTLFCWYNMLVQLPPA